MKNTTTTTDAGQGAAMVGKRVTWVETIRFGPRKGEHTAEGTVQRVHEHKRTGKMVAAIVPDGKHSDRGRATPGHETLPIRIEVSRLTVVKDA